MATYSNCQSMTRRDCLQLGLGGFLGLSLVDVLRARGKAAERGQRPKLHPRLDGRRPQPLRNLRPQTRCPHRDQGRVRAD